MFARYGPNDNAARKMLVPSGFPRKQSRVPPPVGRINSLVSTLERMSHYVDYSPVRSLRAWMSSKLLNPRALDSVFPPPSEPEGSNKVAVAESGTV